MANGHSDLIDLQNAEWLADEEAANEALQDYFRVDHKPANDAFGQMCRGEITEAAYFEIEDNEREIETAPDTKTRNY